MSKRQDEIDFALQSGVKSGREEMQDEVLKCVAKVLRRRKHNYLKIPHYEVRAYVLELRQEVRKL